MSTKIFITVFIVEGKGQVPEAISLPEYSEHADAKDNNVYKRVAEYCLDISDIRTDQMVHKLTLSLPIKSHSPKPGPLFNTLRNCNISALFND